ncbi:MAG: VOC family protein [Rhodospirillaceae bacterium]|jgi:catechol-2,3-dioxygenase|nr:VOC family protein [Rhodospirillaceae bacterium]MBT4488825.1 VOC family protein [Rhodospirillaceae bacterium]MBT5195379.1 VOC family protein [Rhodospirillaceae bacterium]MBT5898487.1 VOC family protein [Rhodospirillaceae bacterium]MBT6429720.1 VOC family protein [Rhodospirillaceae bacterium]
MAVVGIEEIFLKVRNMENALEFYNGMLGIPLDKRDDERTYLQMERGHLVLQMEVNTGRHQGGGPLHFALTVTEETFDEIMEKFVGSRYFTRGPYGERGVGRALFMMDPDGNEAEINTRYLYGVPQR